MLCCLLRIQYAPAWKIFLLLGACYLLNIKNDIAILQEMNNFYHDPNAYHNYIMIAIVSLIYLFFLLSALGKLDFPQLKLPAQAGLLSYPLYLIHGFGIGAFMLWGTPSNKYILLAVVILVIITLSYIIYRYVELPGQQRLKTWLTRLSKANEQKKPADT